jgi:hypothetical protein
MKNPATQSGEELNEFTQYIKDNPSCMVKLRDGVFVQPVFMAAEDEHCTDTFATVDWTMCWNMDGSSVTRYSLDMMEIEKP